MDIIKMNPEVKALWVAKLRDPTIKQISNRLSRNDESFCCLGVLTELFLISDANVTKIEWKNHSDRIRSFNGQTYNLPTEVMTWAGLTLYDPVVTFGCAQFNLTSLNDGMRLTFPQIADLIEKDL